MWARVWDCQETESAECWYDGVYMYTGILVVRNEAYIGIVCVAALAGIPGFVRNASPVIVKVAVTTNRRC